MSEVLKVLATIKNWVNENEWEDSRGGLLVYTDDFLAYLNELEIANDE